jgi:hypothetical protein
MIAANATLTEVSKRRSDEAVRNQTYHRDLSQSDDRAVDVVARMEAQMNIAASDIKLIKLDMEVSSARHAVEAAREQVRDAIAAEYQPQLRAAVAELKAALLAARTANAKVQRIQMDQHSATTRPFDGAGVATLNALVEHWLSIHADE